MFGKTKKNVWLIFLHAKQQLQLSISLKTNNSDFFLGEHQQEKCGQKVI